MWLLFYARCEVSIGNLLLNRPSNSGKGRQMDEPFTGKLRWTLQHCCERRKKISCHSVMGSKWKWLKITRNKRESSSPFLEHVEAVNRRRAIIRPNGEQRVVPHRNARTHPRLNIFYALRFIAVALLMLLILYRPRARTPPAPTIHPIPRHSPSSLSFAHSNLIIILNRADAGFEVLVRFCLCYRWSRSFLHSKCRLNTHTLVAC